MNYKHCCVIDADNMHKAFVLVLLESNLDGTVTEKVQGYAMRSSDRLLDVLPPDMIKARWTGTVWEEAATPEEIAAHKAARQALFN